MFTIWTNSHHIFSIMLLKSPHIFYRLLFYNPALPYLRKNRYIARFLQNTLQNLARKCIILPSILQESSEKGINLAKKSYKKHKNLARILQEIHYPCKRLARKIWLMQKSSTKQMSLGRISQELYYSRDKNVQIFFQFLQRMIQHVAKKDLSCLCCKSYFEEKTFQSLKICLSLIKGALRSLKVEYKL